MNRTSDRGKASWGRLAVLMVALQYCSCTTGVRLRYDLPEFRNAVASREVQMVAMRDGVKLATDIYTPDTPGPWPVVLIRDPYSAYDLMDPINQTLCRYGYMVVHQDVRGRLRSEGEWNPIFNERKDGIDTIEWLKQQSFFDGNLALYGPSYLGIAQWVLLDGLPPEVKTIIPQVASTSLYDSVYEDGMFRHEFLSFWASAMPSHGLAPLNQLTYQEAIRTFPSRTNRIALEGELPWYREWQRSVSPRAPLWQTPDLTAIQTALASTDVPVLMVGGWYGIFLRGQLDDFEKLHSRSKSRFIVGPWTHLMGFSGDGEKPFPNSPRFGMLDDKLINWLDHHLKGLPLEPWGPLYAYRIGEGTWESFEQWPATEAVRFHLAGANAATTCAGGRLETTQSAFVERVHYRYDPLDPVPTRGGSQLLAFAMPGYGGAAPSNRDQAGLCARDDVLTFITPRFKDAFRLSGPMRLHLTVRSTADDTAFTAKLIEVAPDGTALNIRDGITSLAWRNGATAPQPYRPGDDVEVTIDLTRLEWTLAKGSRLRVDVSSSNFPAFHAHPNVAGLWSDVERPKVARQTITLGRGASCLDLGRRQTP